MLIILIFFQFDRTPLTVQLLYEAAENQKNKNPAPKLTIA
jgi:hypothetical protein